MRCVDWLNHALGTDGGAFYRFYSGFGTAIGSITLLGGLATFFQTRRCQVDGCTAVGKRTVPGTDWKVCPGHHPDGPLTQEKIERHMRDRRERQEGEGA